MCKRHQLVFRTVAYQKHVYYGVHLRRYQWLLNGISESSRRGLGSELCMSTVGSKGSETVSYPKCLGAWPYRSPKHQIPPCRQLGLNIIYMIGFEGKEFQRLWRSRFTDNLLHTLHTTWGANVFLGHTPQGNITRFYQLQRVSHLYVAWKALI